MQKALRLCKLLVARHFLDLMRANFSKQLIVASYMKIIAPLIISSKSSWMMQNIRQHWRN